MRRRPGGGVRVRLAAREREALRALPDQLTPLLRGEADFATPSGNVSERLFPRAYEDPLAEIEYHELVGAGIAEERIAALETFAATLDRGHAGARTWTVELTAEEADAWLSALNDARLTLGMVAGIAKEQDWEQVNRRADAAGLLLAYLGWLQEELVAALLGSVEE